MKDIKYSIVNRLLLLNFKTEKVTELKTKEQRNIFLIVIFKLIKVVVKFTLYYYLKFFELFKMIKFDALIDEDSKPIISLTTFPQRIHSLWMVIYTIYNQSVQPGKIILTLASQEFPKGLDQVPGSIKQFIDSGLEIIFVNANLKPHNKYYYSFKKYPNRTIITIDDDLLYYHDTIERLLNLSKKYPYTICSNRIQLISQSGNKFNTTKKWEHIYYPTLPSHFNFALGYGSVLYPSNFRGKSIFNIDKISELSLMADDLWLKSMEIVEGIKVVCGDYFAHPVMIPFSQKKALRFVNSEKNVNGNDEQWHNLTEEYDIFDKIKL